MPMRRSTLLKLNGFTLIELIVVLLLITILSVSVVPRFFDTSDFTRITQRDQTVSVLRSVQQRAMQNTQNVSGTNHRVDFNADNLGLSDILTANPCGSDFLAANDHLTDHLVVCDVDDFSATNASGASITSISFDSWGRPTPNTGSCATGGCELSFGVSKVCIESQGYIHVCG